MKKPRNGLLFPKLLMSFGALWLMGYSIAAAISNDVNAGLMYGFKVIWPLLTFVSIIFIIIPFSVKPKTWTLVWGLVVTAFAVIFLTGSLVNVTNYRSVWVYITITPYIMITIGAILWTITAYKK